MARRANPSRNFVAVLVCLVAVLGLLAPLVNCTMPAGHAAMKMAPGDDCCGPELASLPSCCIAHPQPVAQLASGFATFTPHLSPLLFAMRDAVPVVRPVPVADLLRERPPLLHPILRI